MELKFELKSEKDFESTVVSLRENLQTEGFGVLWAFDIQEKLLEKGLACEDKVLILEVCNPEKAAEALRISGDAAYLLPCKVAVSQREDGVYAGLLRPGLLAEMIVDEALGALAHDVERHLKRAVLESV